DLFVEGMVHVSTLPRDFYRYLEKQHALVGERTKALFRLGDRVTVRIANVSTERRQLDFVLVKASSMAGEETETADNTKSSGRRRTAGKGNRAKRNSR
ncbi:MAG TPA: ribonuclease R, partial [Geobacteraceae bacterium]|nr:ribonuclease R [Geobacteraceae bacterium]